jgi:signal transduction histidine kinase
LQDLSYLEEPGIKECFQKSQYGMIEIIVKDTGIGIKEEDLKKLFKLFGFLN